MFTAMPGWREIIGAMPNDAPPDGGVAAPAAPLGAADWVVLHGPSLTKAERLIAIARSSLPDATIDATLAASAKGSVHGGTFDTGVPGVVAVRADAGGAEHVLMRVQRGVVIMAPLDRAAQIARDEQRAAFPARIRPGEGLRVIVKDPSKHLLPNTGRLPSYMSELRMWADLHDDGSADVWTQGDCDTPQHAEEARVILADGIARQNGSMLVRIATHGLLNNVMSETAGNTVKLHVAASRDQVEALVGLVLSLAGPSSQP
jgi:hypothetical protein